MSHFHSDLLLSYCKYLDVYDLVPLVFVCKQFNNAIRTIPALRIAKYDHSPTAYMIYLAEKNYLSLLKWARKKFAYPLDISCYVNVISHGNLKVLKWMFKRSVAEARDRAHLAKTAAREGQLAILRWLCGNSHGCEYDTSVADSAALGGHLDVLKWIDNYSRAALVHTLQSRFYLPSWNGHACSLAAARGGHLEILQWMRTRDPSCQLSFMACTDAAEEGHLHVLRWLRSQNCTWYHTTATKGAARYGHLETLKYALDNGSEYNEQEMFCAAVTGGHFNVLKYLADRYNQFTPNFSPLFNEAASSGHIHVLEWLCQRCNPPQWDANTCKNAVKGKHIKTLKWLRCHDPPCPWNETLLGTILNTMAIDRQAVFEWAIRSGCPVSQEWISEWLASSSPSTIQIILRTVAHISW